MSEPTGTRGRGGRPTNEERRRRRILKALERVEDLRPRLVEKVADLLEDPATPAAVVVQLLQLLERLLPGGVSLERLLPGGVSMPRASATDWSRIYRQVIEEHAAAQPHEPQPAEQVREPEPSPRAEEEGVERLAVAEQPGTKAAGPVDALPAAIAERVVPLPPVLNPGPPIPEPRLPFERRGHWEP